MPQSLVPQAILDAIGYERMKAGHIKGVLPILNKLREDIYDVILRMDSNSNKDVSNRIKRINNLVDAAFKKIETLSLREYKDLSELVIEKEDNNLVPITGVQEPIAGEKIDKVVPVILASLILGKSYRRHMMDLRSSVKSQTASQIRTGVADNENITTIARRVRGTRTRRFADGSFASTIRHVDSITRTVIQGYISRAKLWTWKQRGINKYRWISVLDNRTTPVCMGRSNKVYRVGEGPTPPAHHNCRSIIVPYVQGAKVPQSYSEFLRSLPREQVEDILGKGKAALFLSGKIKLDKFTTVAGRELTLPQLREKSRK